MARAFQVIGFQRDPAFQTEDEQNPQSTGAGGSFGGGEWLINARSSGGLSDDSRALLERIFTEQEAEIVLLPPDERMARRLVMQRNLDALIIILAEV